MLGSTYTRDSFTGLDYADQRFYASTYGRFNTADPSDANVDRSNPASMNLYSYVNGDPGNLNDPSGLQACAPSDPTCSPGDTFDQWGGDNNWDYERPWSLWSPDRWIQDPTGSGFLSNGYGQIAAPLSSAAASAVIACMSNPLMCAAAAAASPEVMIGAGIIVGATAVWVILTNPPAIPPIETRRLMKVRADCSVHQNGTPDHASAGTISATGSGFDFASARASAYASAQAAVKAGYGIGYHAQHCGYTLVN